MAEIEYDKLTRRQKTIYDMWKLQGKSTDDDELVTLLGIVNKPTHRVRKENVEIKEAISREAEAVLLHLRRTDTLMQKECLECHLPFATNYHFAGRCSDNCIKASLEKVGIKWNPEKTAQERWNGPDVNSEIPAIIEPETLLFLKQWARTILSWDNSAFVDAENYRHNGGLEYSHEMKIGEVTVKAYKSDNVEPNKAYFMLEEDALRNEHAMAGSVYDGTDTENYESDDPFADF